MNKAMLAGIVRSKIIGHEQVHDERVVEREELVAAIAGAIEQRLTEEMVETRRKLIATIGTLGKVAEHMRELEALTKVV